MILRRKRKNSVLLLRDVEYGNRGWTRHDMKMIRALVCEVISTVPSIIAHRPRPIQIDGSAYP